MFLVDVEQGFMPWLMERVSDTLTKSVLGRTVLDGLLREVVAKRCEEYAKLEQTAQSEQLAQEAESAGGQEPEPEVEVSVAPAEVRHTELHLVLLN